ncbi:MULTISPECIES: hypothetical protein [Lacticaseibacillus]|uniref:Uncharacterized protein n=2 Tax=Lacticaseibacillus TaxID=2759736 RepID=A0ABZ0BUW2_LACCA|nr:MULTISPECIES: hypothetical protein [Lacticaseibacillus]KAB1968908.1 hypothetical protein F9B82_11565 [Lacticaseibacillus casei]WLV79656.1 hypothetical protein LACSTY_001672 [Lacticaseibacillus sp. NCIMB 15473]WNX23616.1 hypothetical protein RWA15_08070 [Lacticaseibacillus casei]WNX26391.1 hypothetical protein RWA16_08075 [Lacticaseibacillus casei]
MAYLVSMPPGQVTASATFETEARVQIVIEPTGQRGGSLPLPDFKSIQIKSSKVPDRGLSSLSVESGDARYLPKLNEWIKNSLVLCGIGILLIASVLYGRKKVMDRLTLKKG